jgi:hypothetical protein
VTTDVPIDDVVAACEAGVEYRGEQRGFDKQRGVPDSVFWLRPADDRLTCQLFPVLVELEGTFAGAAPDFEKFAARRDDPDYQYHLEWPVVGATSRDRIVDSMRYEIIGIRANQLAGHHSISERVMHEELAAWFDRFAPKFETSATVRDHLSPPIVEWSVAFTMFGHHYEVQVPFFIGDGTEVDSDILRYVSTPTIPSVVVVNGKHDQREKAIVYHDTAIEFPSIHPIRFHS